MWKRSLFVLGLWFLLPVVSHAYIVNQSVPAVPYEVLPVERPDAKQLLIGTLDQYPVMYEVESDKEFDLDLELRAVPEDTLPHLGAIVVRVLEPRGVEEVHRLKYEEGGWGVGRDETSGLKYAAGPAFSKKLPAGRYQIEVHTPDNIGRYMLHIGKESASFGYFASLSSVSALYEFYGVSKLGMIKSPLVYYPLLILFVLVALGYTVYRTRHLLPFKNHA